MQTVRIQRVDTAPIIDGALSDEIWQQVEWYGDFRVVDTPEKSADPPTSFTTVHDGTTLFIAIRADEPQLADVKLETDAALFGSVVDDRLEIFIDTTGQGNQYLQLFVNSAGLSSRRLGDIRNEAFRLDLAVGSNQSGWTMAAAIPLADLPLQPQSSTWRFNLVRFRCLGGAQPSLVVSSFMPLKGHHVQFHGYPFAQVEGLDLAPYLWDVTTQGTPKLQKTDDGFAYAQRLKIANMASQARHTEIRCALETAGRAAGEVILSDRFEPFEERTELVETHLADEDFGNLIVVMSDPVTSRESFSRRICHRASADPSWRPHFIRQGDGEGGYINQPAAIRFVPRYDGEIVSPYGLAPMDNGEIAMIGASVIGAGAGGSEHPVIAFSPDGGASWSEYLEIKGARGRPMMLAYLGNGKLTFSEADIVGDKYRYFSCDYGRTWPEKVLLQPLDDGEPFETEGNPLVDRDASGTAVRIAETGYSRWADNPSREYIRWSSDGGRTWDNEMMPDAWRWAVEYQGKTHIRSCWEGGLVRAANGWIVASLRTDHPPRYRGTAQANDSNNGIAVSISKDDGATWTPLPDRILFEGGRHHQHLVLLANGDIVMTYIERTDMRDGEFASYRRGCEAIVSHDNGLTWDLDRVYILDEWAYYDGANWCTAKCGHKCSAVLNDGHILTAYTNWLAGSVIIRWRPEA